MLSKLKLEITELNETIFFSLEFFAITIWLIFSKFGNWGKLISSSLYPILIVFAQFKESNK